MISGADAELRAIERKLSMQVVNLTE